MELATLRTLYFANLYLERVQRRRLAEIVRASAAADGRLETDRREVAA